MVRFLLVFHLVGITFLLRAERVCTEVVGRALGAAWLLRPSRANMHQVVWPGPGGPPCRPDPLGRQLCT